MTAKPTCVVVFDTPTEYVDRSLPTASWWDKYEIQPGVYPLEWVDIDYRPWEPDVIPPGYVANPGPYYALARFDVRLVESYRVNRLLAASSAEHRIHDDAAVTQIVRTVYAYQVPGCPKGQHGKPLASWLGGRVVDAEFHKRAIEALGRPEVPEFMYVEKDGRTYRAPVTINPFGLPTTRAGTWELVPDEQ